MSKTHNITTMGGRRVVSPRTGSQLVRRRGGQAAASGSGAMAGAQLFEALTVLGKEAAATVRHLSEGSLERKDTAAWERAEIARLQEAGLMVREHLAQAHTERQAALAGLTIGLDAAIAAQDMAAVTAVLESMVSLLESTPLADLAKLDSVAAKLGDPKAVWTL